MRQVEHRYRPEEAICGVHIARHADRVRNMHESVQRREITGPEHHRICRRCRIQEQCW